MVRPPKSRIMIRATFTESIAGNDNDCFNQGLRKGLESVSHFVRDVGRGASYIVQSHANGSNIFNKN